MYVKGGRGLKQHKLGMKDPLLQKGRGDLKSTSLEQERDGKHLRAVREPGNS